jgi:hypothetical protein
MRKFSRWMPAAPVQKTPIWAWPILALFLFGSVYAIYRGYPYSLIILGAVGMATWVMTMLEARRLRGAAADRRDESICTFVRSFAYRQTDPWVLRAVYEELGRYWAIDGRSLPLRAEDRWEEDLLSSPDS